MSETAEMPSQTEAKKSQTPVRRWRWVVLFLLSSLVGWLWWFPPSLNQLIPWLIGTIAFHTGKTVELSSLVLDGASGVLATQVAVRPSPTASPILTAEQVRLGLHLGDWWATGKPISLFLSGVRVEIPEQIEKDGEEGSNPFAVLPTGSLRLQTVDIFHQGAAWQGIGVHLDNGQILYHQDGRADWQFHGQLLHGGKKANLQGEGQWNKDHSWRGGWRMEKVQPSLLGPLVSGISPLATMQSPLDLSAQVEGVGVDRVQVDWNLEMGKGQFAFPELFRWPFPITRMTAQGQVVAENAQVNLMVNAFTLKSDHATGEGKFTLTGLGGSDPHLELKAKIWNGPVEKANYYYPVTIMSGEVVHWLDTSLLHGRVLDANVNIRGPLNHFPFDTYPKDKDGKATAFRIEANIEDASVLFHPDLPPISQARTKLIFDRLSMEAHVQEGVLIGSRQIKGKVRIGDMLRNPTVEVDGTALADLASLWQQVIAHPGLKWDEAIGLAGTELKGQGAMEFSLRLPLEGTNKATYQGKLDLVENWARLPFLQQPFAKVRGGITANQNQVKVVVEHADYGGVPVFGTVEASGISNPALAGVLIKMRGVLPHGWLASRLSEVAEKEVVVTGDAPLQAVLERKTGEAGFGVDGQLVLKNVAIAGFPGLEKKVGEGGEAQLSGRLGGDGQFSLKKLLVKLASLEVNGQGEVDLAWLSKDEKELKGKKVRPLSLALKGGIPMETLSPWLKPVLGEEGSLQGPATWRLNMGNKPGKPGVRLELNADLSKVKVKGDWGWRKERGSEGQWNTTGWLQKNGVLEVEKIKGKIGNLEINGNGQLRLRQETGRLELKSFSLGKTNGSLLLVKEMKEGKEKYQVETKLKELDLSHELSKKSSKEERDRPPQVTDGESWPRFHFKMDADHLTLANGLTGKELQVQAASKGSLLRLERLNFQLGEKKVTSSGEMIWLEEKDWGDYSGQFNLSTGDIGGLLKALDWHTGLKGGEGGIGLQVAGNVPRGEKLLNHLEGKGKIQGKDGVVQEARFLTTLLSLLSISELPKLLTGDRPDLEGEGFYYKKVGGDFVIKKGIVRSDNLTLAGPAMTIVISGDMDLPEKRLNMLVGARVFQMLDKILTNIPVVGKLITGSRHSLWETQFDVTGPMEDPKWSVRPVDSLVPGIFRDILDLPGKMFKMEEGSSAGEGNKGKEGKE
ncbi:MAG: hypothetical protein G8345_04660 [Magnetococcales bacterium]|nr:AsmA-like C-terminal domain-containing protein [Magnetococcales bacterium]NGZ26162.1 hypothetical protein [Magnetococcales bacterium]